MSQPLTDLVLASTSPYRKAQLARLVPQFATEAPDVAEDRQAGESPRMMALRLAEAKAHAVARRRPGAVVIGGDQVAAIGNDVLGKPGNTERAAEQLRQSSGRAVVFYTAVCVLGPQQESDTWVSLTTIRFRDLDEARIARYLERDEPFDCAGSFKSEAAGIALFESVESDDPTAIEGLPLIRLTDVLNARGFSVP